MLGRAGARLVVVSNQAGVARGYYGDPRATAAAFAAENDVKIAGAVLSFAAEEWAAFVAVASVVATGAAVWLRIRSPAAAVFSSPDAVMAIAYPILAMVILRRQPHNRAGHLLLTTGLLGPYLLAGAFAVDAVLVHVADGKGGPGRFG